MHDVQENSIQARRSSPRQQGSTYVGNPALIDVKRKFNVSTTYRQFEVGTTFILNSVTIDVQTQLDVSTTFIANEATIDVPIVQSQAAKIAPTSACPMAKSRSRW